MKIQSVRGMQDLLPAQKEVFRHIEDVARDILDRYGYVEIGLPHLESTRLFERLVGESTDIVEKEMYTFEDRNGESISLRPEGTAGCVRHALQNGLIFNRVQRFWYAGAMFRHERPQQGRYRQFEQIGAECFGMPGPDIDAELLMMNQRMWRALSLDGQVALELNSLGSSESRQKYRVALQDYLSQYTSDLDEDSRRRLATNPLRILDSKVAATRKVLEGAPLLPDYLDDDSKRDFETLCGLLEDNGVDYAINSRMVRGLDYYNKTVFEWVTGELGSQGAVCSGGRYDSLVEQLGGKPTPGAGFAMGVDRLALMLEATRALSWTADVYVVSWGNEARARALALAESLRTELVNSRIVVHCGGGRFKAQMKKADASGARLAVIVGEDEVASGRATVKLLREEREQLQVPFERLGSYCAGFLTQG